MPAFGLGRTGRPAATGGLGYAPVGSVLPPVDSIVSDEPLDGLTSYVPPGATSELSDDSVLSAEPLSFSSVLPSDIIGAEGDDVVSEEPRDIVSETPSDLESEEPI